jgi:molybdopterin synthase sulfur carrier subunit
MRFPLVSEATITRDDFVRLLRLANGAAGFKEIDGVFRGPGWRIRLTPLAPLEIGAVRLERHRVEIEFEGLMAAERDDFMRRFTLCFQRGGG